MASRCIVAFRERGVLCRETETHSCHGGTNASTCLGIILNKIKVVITSVG